MRSFEAWLSTSFFLLICLMGATGCEPASGSLNVLQDLRLPPEAPGQPPQTLVTGQYTANVELSGQILKLALKSGDGRVTDIHLPVPSGLQNSGDSVSYTAAEAGIDYDVTANIEIERSFGPEINTSEPCTWTTTVTSCVDFDGSGKKCSDQAITHAGMHLVRYRERSEARNLRISLHPPGLAGVTAATGANAQAVAASFEGTAHSKNNVYERNDACE
jgi:hypothetical protein